MDKEPCIIIMLKKKIFLIFYITLIIALLVGCGGCTNQTDATGGASLTWSAPTTKSDGTQLTDLAGFRVYYGTTSGIYSHVLDVGNVTNYKIISLSPGTYYFTVTCYDSSRRESNFSTEVSTTIL